MRNIFFGMTLALLLVFGFRYCEHTIDQREELQVSSALIQKQLQNVGKLIVTEGSYAQVFSYEDSKEFYLDLFSSDKRALVVVNATASIAYDLSKVKTQIDEEKKMIIITSVPEPELTIIPNIEYYDITQDYLNQFEASDYNKIKKRVEVSLREKIEASILKTIAHNGLISELQKIYLLTSSMGWILQFENQIISEEKDLQDLKF